MTRSLALYSLGMVFLGVLIWRSRVWGEWGRLEEIGPLTLVLVPLLSLGLSLPLALRQRAILRVLNRDRPIWSLFPIAYYGNTAGFLTPAASGELLRPALFERGLNVPLPQGVAVVLFERLFSIFLLGLSGLVALTWSGIVPWQASAALLPFLLAGVFAPLVAYRALRAFGPRLPLARLRRLLPAGLNERIASGLQQSNTALQVLWQSPGLAGYFSLFTFAVFAVMLLQFWLLVNGAGEDISPAQAWVVLTTSSIAGILSGLPLGLGATDAVMVSLLGTYGIGLSAAVTIAVLTRCLINLPTGVMALLAYLTAVRQRPPAGVRADAPEVDAPRLASPQAMAVPAEDS